MQITRRVLVALVVALAAIGAANVAAHPSHGTFPTACSMADAHRAAMVAPCAEIDRAVHEAAAEFGIDEARLRRAIVCESHFVDVVTNGQYIGLGQHGSWFRSTYPRQFDEHVAVDLAAGTPTYSGPGTYDPRAPFQNARLTAWVVSRGGYSQWSCKG